LRPQKLFRPLRGRNSFWGLNFFRAHLLDWTFDYFPCSAAKRSLRECFAANLILVPIFPETLTQSAFQEKSAQFSQKASTD
jgi:hypothetical protein